MATEVTNSCIDVNISRGYKGSKQLYKPDDNTITIDNLVFKLKALEERMQQAGLSLSTNTFDSSMLEQF